MNTLNASLREVSDWLLSPLGNRSPLLALVFVSVLTGIVMTIVFRFTSHQRQLRHIADLCRADLLAIKLFKDQPSSMFRAVASLLRHTMLRLWYSLPPALVMLVPFVIAVVHLAQWYEYRPLYSGAPRGGGPRAAARGR